MKYIGGTLLVLLLGSCGMAEPSNCDKVKDGEAWMQRDALTKTEIHDEIDALIVANRCDGITPEKLNKVLHDIARAK